MNLSLKQIFLFVVVSTLLLAGCKEEGCTDSSAINYDSEATEDDGSCEFNIPNTCSQSDYCFNRDGEFTVSYSGQTTRLNQLAEMTSYMKTANSGNPISAAQLREMFSNNNGSGSSFYSSDAIDASKQLKNKTFISFQADYEALMDAMQIASESTTSGSNGTAGVVTSSNDPSVGYLFDQNGFEHTQLIEKGLMGDCFYFQAMDTYISGVLSEAYGNDILEGKTYTENEHKFDEAFGYIGIPTDFLTNTAEARFHGKYCNSRDEVLETNAIFNSFNAIRQAITDQNQEQIETLMPTLRLHWHRIIAGTAVHYLNAALANIDDPALKMHTLSEAYAFIGNLIHDTEDYAISINQRDECRTLLGSNFYETTATDINATKEWLVANTSITLIESANL